MLYLAGVVLSAVFLAAVLAGVGLVAAAGLAVVGADDLRAALFTAPCAATGFFGAFVVATADLALTALRCAGTAVREFAAGAAEPAPAPV